MEIKLNVLQLVYMLAVYFVSHSEAQPKDGNVTMRNSSPMNYILSTLQRNIADLSTPHYKRVQIVPENPDINTSSNFGVIQRTVSDVNDTALRDSSEGYNDTGKTSIVVAKSRTNLLLTDSDESSTLSHERTTESNTVIQTVRRKMNKNTVNVIKSNKTTMQVTSLQDLLDVYNPSRLVVVWNRTDITTKCNNDMLLYLDGLRRGYVWALQSK